MSKLHFYFSVMNSAKSANLIMVAHNYNELGKRALVLKPNLDTRTSKGEIQSRVGVSIPCIDIDKDENLIDLYKKENTTINNNIQVILIDEANFLTKKQVEQLAYIVDNFNVPVMAYGLKNSYLKSQLFEGSEALLYYAEEIREIRNICHCGRKATMNLRILNGNPVYDGEIINCGDTKPTDDYYIPVCRKHYFNPIIK